MVKCRRTNLKSLTIDFLRVTFVSDSSQFCHAVISRLATAWQRSAASIKANSNSLGVLWPRECVLTSKLFNYAAFAHVLGPTWFPVRVTISVSLVLGISQFQILVQCSFIQTEDPPVVFVSSSSKRQRQCLTWRHGRFLLYAFQYIY